jgi:competence protein ComEA
MALSERRLVVLLLTLAVLGHLAKLAVGRPEEAPGAIRLLPGGSASRPGSLEAQRALAERVARPLAPGERIDADRADIVEFARLPGIGPVLAKRIVAERSRSGPFRSLAGLDRVPGIGPSLLAELEPHVSFSAPLAATRAPAPGSILGVPAPEPGPASLVPINHASAAELEALPGIGRIKAREIVAYRELHGPFATLEQLGSVRGIGPAMLARLGPLVRVP